MACHAILLLCIIGFVGQSNAARLKREILGRDANIEEAPYQVSLRSYDSHFCGGSIIDEKHIVTAAHCFKSEQSPEWDSVTVVSGTSFAKEPGNVHEIVNITVHTGYKSDGNSAQNDIAVITLKEAIVFSKQQNKLNLPKNNYKVGERATVTGWGLTKQEPPVLPNRLQRIDTTLMSQEECQKTVIDPKTTKIYDTQICTIRKKDAGICSGDSGGPLASNGELIGVVSWFDGDNCVGHRPNVFTNVFKFKRFVECVINQKFPCS